MDRAIRQKRKAPTLVLRDGRDPRELLRGREFGWTKDLQLLAADCDASVALDLRSDLFDFGLEFVVLRHYRC